MQKLPYELIEIEIIKYLPIKDILNLCQHKIYENICENDETWLYLLNRDFEYIEWIKYVSKENFGINKDKNSRQIYKLLTRYKDILFIKKDTILDLSSKYGNNIFFNKYVQEKFYRDLRSLSYIEGKTLFSFLGFDISSILSHKLHEILNDDNINKMTFSSLKFPHDKYGNRIVNSLTKLLPTKIFEFYPSSTLEMNIKEYRKIHELLHGDNSFMNNIVHILKSCYAEENSYRNINNIIELIDYFTTDNFKGDKLIFLTKYLYWNMTDDVDDIVSRLYSEIEENHINQDELDTIVYDGELIINTPYYSSISFKSPTLYFLLWTIKGWFDIEGDKENAYFEGFKHIKENIYELILSFTFS